VKLKGLFLIFLILNCILIDCSIKVAEGKEDLKALIKEHMDSFQKLVKKEKSR